MHKIVIKRAARYEFERDNGRKMMLFRGSFAVDEVEEYDDDDDDDFNEVERGIDFLCFIKVLEVD